MCEGEIIEDAQIVDAEEQKQIIQMATNVYQNLKQKLQNSPDIIREEVAKKFEREPFISETADIPAKIKWAEQVSIYVASIIQAESRNLPLLYRNNLRERLEWCQTELMRHQNPINLFRGEGNGILTFLKFAAFFVVCVAILLGARYIDFDK